MVYIVTQSEYPSHVATAISKRYLEMLQKYPPDPSLGDNIVPAAAKRTESGIRVITVTEVSKGQLEAAMERIQNQLAMFNDIEDAEVSLDVYMNASEALATIGMKLPE